MGNMDHTFSYVVASLFTSIVIKSICFVELPYLAKYILVACLTYSATVTSQIIIENIQKKVKLQSTDQMYLWIIFPCHRNR